jgi:hypothetical protein
LTKLEKYTRKGLNIYSYLSLWIQVESNSGKCLKFFSYNAFKYSVQARVGRPKSTLYRQGTKIPEQQITYSKSHLTFY